MNSINSGLNRTPAALVALLCSGILPISGMAAPAPNMAVFVPPPAQVVGIGMQTQQGIGVTWESFESTRNTRRSGTSNIDNPVDERTVSWRNTVLIDYNVYRDFTAILAVPYVYNKATFTGVDQKTSAFGDIALYGKYPIYKDQLFNARQEIQAIGGIEFPTGSTHTTDADGHLLSASEQAGSGTTNFIIGSAVVWGFRPLSLYGDATYKIYRPGSYSFGNVFSTRLGMNYPLPIYRPFRLTGEVLAQFVGRDHSAAQGSGVLPNGQVDSSGGETIFLAPGFQWVFLNTWTASTSFQLPVYQNLRGTQLKSDVNIDFALSTRFGAGAPTKEEK